MTVVPKEILRVGHYHTNRGTLLITKDRLKHFEDDGNQMIADNLSVPLPLNHQPEAYPATAQDLANRVKNNTGFAKRYYLLGDSLWCDLDVTDPEIEPKLNSTIKFVSPQISPKFIDGRGRKWLDVITHIALTPRPRFIDQKPFGSLPSTVAQDSLLSSESFESDYSLSLDDYMEENQLAELLSNDDDDSELESLTSNHGEHNPTANHEHAVRFHADMLNYHKKMEHEAVMALADEDHKDDPAKASQTAIEAHKHRMMSEYHSAKMDHHMDQAENRAGEADRHGEPLDMTKERTEEYGPEYHEMSNDEDSHDDFSKKYKDLDYAAAFHYHQAREHAGRGLSHAIDAGSDILHGKPSNQATEKSLDYNKRMMDYHHHKYESISHQKNALFHQHHVFGKESDGSQSQANKEADERIIKHHQDKAIEHEKIAESHKLPGQTADLSNDEEGVGEVHKIYSKYAKKYGTDPDAWTADNAAANTAGTFSVDTAPFPPHPIPFSDHKKFHNDMANFHAGEVARHNDILKDPKSSEHDKKLAKMDSNGHQYALHYHSGRASAARAAEAEHKESVKSPPADWKDNQENGDQMQGIVADDMRSRRTHFNSGGEPSMMSDDSPFFFGFVNKNGDLPIELGETREEGIYGAPVNMSKDPESSSKAGDKMMKDLPKESWSSMPTENDHNSIERQAILGPRLWAGKKESGKTVHRTAPMHKDDQPLFKKIAAIPPMFETAKTVFVHPHADILHPADLASFHEAMARHHANKKGTYVFKQAGADGVSRDGVYPHMDREHDLAQRWHDHMAGIHRHNAALMKYFGGSKESFGWKHARKARYGDHLAGLNQEPEMIHSFVD